MLKRKVVILGGGMVGQAMAMDMARTGFDVTVVDARRAALDAVAKYGVKTLEADLGSPDAIKKVVAPFDMVMGALSSRIGLQTLRAVIEAKKTYIDISFMGENAWELDALAKEHGVCAVVDCGVAPGVSNMALGWAAAQMESAENLEVYVGGLPVVRKWPFEYKAGFAPHDVIEEYVRPSRVVERGEIVLKAALSEPELMNFDGVGTLEAFNTDGLRSLAYTMKIPFMKEKTLRYPGHIELMRVLRETGFFSQEPITVDGKSVRPLDVTANLMFKDWTYAEGEADLTVLRFFIEGKEKGQRVRHQWELLDYYDAETGFRSMSRTTGYSATSMAVLLGEGLFDKPGVHPPENVGKEPGLLDRFLAEYAKRGCKVRHTRTVL